MLKQKYPSLRRTLLVNGLIPSLLILLLGVLLFIQVLRVWDQANQVGQTVAVQRRANDVQVMLAGTESGLRAYLLTGEPSYLESHLRLNQRIEEELNSLETLVRDNRSQVGVIRSVETMWPAWKQNAERQIKVFDAGERDFAPFITGTQGAPLMNQMQERMAAFVETQGVLLKLQQDALSRTSRFSGVLGALGLLLAIAFFVVFSVRQFRLHERFYRRRMREIESQKVQLSMQLADKDEAVRKVEKQLSERTRALKTASAGLSRMVGLDGLTATRNRRSFEDFLYKAWRNAMRDAAPLSVVLLDFDRFKAYNDAHGPQAGDDALLKVANHLEDNCLEPEAFVARIDGDAFAVVLPELEAAPAQELAEGIRKAVEDLAIAHPASDVARVLTVSVGVATVDEPGVTHDALLKAAQAALAEAKAAGRNRVSQAAAVTANPA